VLSFSVLGPLSPYYLFSYPLSSLLPAAFIASLIALLAFLLRRLRTRLPSSRGSGSSGLLHSAMVRRITVCLTPIRFLRRWLVWTEVLKAHSSAVHGYSRSWACTKKQKRTEQVLSAQFDFLHFEHTSRRCTPPPLRAHFFSTVQQNGTGVDTSTFYNPLRSLPPDFTCKELSPFSHPPLALLFLSSLCCTSSLNSTGTLILISAFLPYPFSLFLVLILTEA